MGQRQWSSSTGTVSSVPLIFSGKTLAEAVLESRVGGLGAFEMLGFRREEAAMPRERHKRCDLAMLVGMILGLLSFYVDMLDIVLENFQITFKYLSL